LPLKIPHCPGGPQLCPGQALHHVLWALCQALWAGREGFVL